MRLLLAIAGGLSIAAAFPKLCLAGLAWIGPGLILAATEGLKPGSTFRLGFLAGLAWHLAALYWLLLIPFRVHGFPLAPITGWLALSAYLALFTGFWAWACHGMLRAIQRDKLMESGENLSWLRRTLWAVSCAALWVALEVIQSRLFTGFPWNLLGASQFRLTPLIQIASVTGVYGVSFLIVWFSGSLHWAVKSLITRPGSLRRVTVEVVAPLAVIALMVSWGFNRMTTFRAKEKTITAALIQPSIEQEVIWNPDLNEERFSLLMQLSRDALTNPNVNVLVWPEAALPEFTEENFRAITNLIASHGVWMVLGADDAERVENAGEAGGYRYFNASFLFNPEGKYASTYRKRRLVIFGEYLPLENWLPFLKWFTPVRGGFTPGKGPVHFSMGNLDTTASVLICFEDVFPHLARHYADEQTDFLLNLTNDGWFGDSAAQWQHAGSAIFRAVENGLPLVRCTNNGLTCWVDAFGRLREIFSTHGGNIYDPGFLLADIAIHRDSGIRPTFYHQHGDVFGAGCLAFSLLAGMSCAARRKLKRGGAQGKPE